MHDDVLVVGEVSLEDGGCTLPAELSSADAYWQRRADGLDSSLKPYAATWQPMRVASAYVVHAGRVRDPHI